MRLAAAAAVLGGLVALALEPGATEVASASEPEPGEEITELRSASSRTYAGAGDTRVAEIYAEPVNYQRSDGEFVPIDNTLIPSDRPGYAYENAANSYTVFFPEDLAEEPVVIEQAGESLSYRLEGASGSPTVDGAEVTYADARPGVELSYRTGATGVEELLEIESPQAEHDFSFEVETSTDLEADASGPGAEFTTGAGEELFAFAPPVVYDAAGASDAVPLEVSGSQGDELSAELGPDPAWAADPARSYPITVDPTVVTKAAIANRDCRIKENLADPRCTGNLKVGVEGTDKHRSLLRFPIKQAVTALNPADSSWATLELRTAPSSGGAAGISVGAHMITQTWDQAYVTWQNRIQGTAWTPTNGGSFTSTADDTNANTGDVIGGPETWNVKQMVKKWVDEGSGGAPNRGVLLKSSGAALVDLYGSEAGEPNAPKLTVAYSDDLGLMSSAPTMDSATYSMRLDWTPTPPNGTTQFQIERREVVDEETKTPWRLIDRVPLSTHTYTDYLLWRGATYEYRLTALSGSLTGPAASIETPIPVPAQGWRFPRLYSDQSFWNKPIPAGAELEPASVRDPIVQNAFVDWKQNSAFVANQSWGMSLVYAAPILPLYSIGCPNGLGTVGYDCNTPVSFSPLPEYANLDHTDDAGDNLGWIHHGATNDGGDINQTTQIRDWDGKLSVINSANGQELGIYEGVYRSNLAEPWSARSRYVSPSGSDASGLVCDPSDGYDYNCNGPTTAGFPNMGGVVRPEEISDGEIRHALNIGTPWTRSSNPVCPATHGTGTHTDAGAIPIGAHVRLPAGYTPPATWPSAAKTIANALRDYGAYINDTSGQLWIQAENEIGRGYQVWGDGAQGSKAKVEAAFGGSSNNPIEDDSFLLTAELEPDFPWNQLQILKMTSNTGAGVCPYPFP